MVGTYSEHGEKYVEGSGGDGIKGLTTNLITNIKDRERKFADFSYDRLLEFIHSRGKKGKDIRYVRAQLNEYARILGKHARILHLKGVESRIKLANMYAQRLPTPKHEIGERNSKQKRDYDSRNPQYEIEQALLREYFPEDANFIHRHLKESGILTQLREKGLTLSEMTKHYDFFPGKRSGKLYIVHNSVMNEVGGSFDEPKSDPEKFFKSEKYKDFRHIRLDSITLVLPRDAASNPTMGIERTSGFYIVPKKDKKFFIDDLVI